MAKAAVTTAEAEVEHRRWKVEKTSIVAPYDGVVTERFVDVGDRVTALPRVEIIEFMDIRFLVAEVGVPERYLEQVRVLAAAPGLYTLRVRGTDVPGSGLPQSDRQGFALVVSSAECAGRPVGAADPDAARMQQTRRAAHPDALDAQQERGGVARERPPGRCGGLDGGAMRHGISKARPPDHRAPDRQSSAGAASPPMNRTRSSAV